MSGHNKWSTIKHKKGAADAKRSKEFSRIIKEISIAVKEGGSDINGNPRLRVAVNNAKGVNMPKDNIERAINKAEKDPANLQAITYEGYGPSGIGFVIECLSDNTNRTVSQVRSVFTRRNCQLGTSGSLSFLFATKGVFVIEMETLRAKGLEPEDAEMMLIEGGADEIDMDEEQVVVYTSMENYGAMQKYLDDNEIVAQNAALQRIPNDTKTLSVEEGLKIMHMVADFEELEDVQNVYHNLELTDELAEALEKEE